MSGPKAALSALARELGVQEHTILIALLIGKAEMEKSTVEQPCEYEVQYGSIAALELQGCKYLEM